MRWFSTLRLLLQFVTRPIRGDNHADRLESFYSYQAAHYDDFRKRFLRGRDELMSRIDFKAGSRWCDLGCGTGFLLEAGGERTTSCSEIILVDLCPSLLRQADKRILDLNLRNARTVLADATEHLSFSEMDVVTLSYSLSMTPDWFSAIDQAYGMLRPGGTIGVADFYVTRKFAESADFKKHRWHTRHFWPAWFDIDNVFPSQDHLPYLCHRFKTRWFFESRTSVPGMPWFRPPYYLWIGSK
jgi:S-adenosylmethionine-diacylgycerolhomoserine-N-methlytransferase